MHRHGSLGRQGCVDARNAAVAWLPDAWLGRLGSRWRHGHGFCAVNATAELCHAATSRLAARCGSHALLYANGGAIITSSEAAGARSSHRVVSGNTLVREHEVGRGGACCLSAQGCSTGCCDGTITRDGGACSICGVSRVLRSAVLELSRSVSVCVSLCARSRAPVAPHVGTKGRGRAGAS